MHRFPPHARVAVRPIEHRVEGDSVIIGDLDRQQFLTIPTSGLDILTQLAAGKTVAETVHAYEQTHFETPDIEDFLDALADAGFVAPIDGETTRTELAPPTPANAGIASTTARRAVSMPTVGLLLVAALAGLSMLAYDPGVLPHPSVLVFHDHVAALTAALFAINLVAVMLHEAGHLLAARASGVPARLRLGHRLWILVVETEMTGMWLAPKRARYLAFLAGPLIDAASAALVIGVLLADRRGAVDLSPTLHQFMSAILLTYLLRLLWQCFVFVRTDLYYVLATALGCKRLLADTEDLLRNHLAMLRNVARPVDQSAIPAGEMRAVRVFAGIWLGGRVLALASLVLITLPVLTAYGEQLARAAVDGDSGLGPIDVVALAVLGICLPLTGLVVWLVSLVRGRTQRRNDAVARS
jgi:putative peptide zinc metalloprotease protein